MSETDSKCILCEEPLCSRELDEFGLCSHCAARAVRLDREQYSFDERITCRLAVIALRRVGLQDGVAPCRVSPRLVVGATGQIHERAVQVFREVSLLTRYRLRPARLRALDLSRCGKPSGEKASRDSRERDRQLETRI